MIFPLNLHLLACVSREFDSWLLYDDLTDVIVLQMKRVVVGEQTRRTVGTEEQLALNDVIQVVAHEPWAVNSSIRISGNLMSLVTVFWVTRILVTYRSYLTRPVSVVSCTVYWEELRLDVKESKASDLFNKTTLLKMFTNLNKLFQKVLNAAARFIFRIPKFDHISVALFHLHWLPVIYRVRFKLLLFVFKALNNQASEYWSNRFSSTLLHHSLSPSLQRPDPPEGPKNLPQDLRWSYLSTFWAITLERLAFGHSIKSYCYCF